MDRITGFTRFTGQLHYDLVYPENPVILSINNKVNGDIYFTLILS